jgi:hypothetical protein
MDPSFEQMLVEVWRQALVENAEVVELESAHYPERVAGLLRTTEIQFLQTQFLCKLLSLSDGCNG